jgi:hypothetical protein
LDVDPRDIAGRLAALADQTVSSLEVRWIVAGQPEPIATAPDFHLQVLREASTRARRVGARLFLREGNAIDTLGIGLAIAEYLDVHEHASSIQLFLSNPDPLLRHHGITDEDVVEEEELLRTRRSFVKDAQGMAPSTPDTEQGADAEEEEPVEQATGGSKPEPSGTSQEEPPARQYVDPATVKFGAERHHSGTGQFRTGSTEAKRRARKSADSYRSPPEREYSGPLVQNKDVEERAVETVVQYLKTRLRATEVIDRQRDNCGWDLDVYLPDGRTIPVEVKGSSGRTPFILSPNELRVARETPAYTVYHVTGIADPDGARMYRFEDIGAQLGDDSALSVSGWAVVGWQSLTFDEIDLT